MKLKTKVGRWYRSWTVRSAIVNTALRCIYFYHKGSSLGPIRVLDCRLPRLSISCIPRYHGLKPLYLKGWSCNIARSGVSDAEAVGRDTLATCSPKAECSPHKVASALGVTWTEIPTEHWNVRLISIEPPKVKVSFPTFSCLLLCLIAHRSSLNDERTEYKTQHCRHVAEVEITEVQAQSKSQVSSQPCKVRIVTVVRQFTS